MINSGRTH